MQLDIEKLNKKKWKPFKNIVAVKSGARIYFYEVDNLKAFLSRCAENDASCGAVKEYQKLGVTREDGYLHYGEKEEQNKDQEAMINIRYYRKMKNIDRLSKMYKTRPYNLLEHQYMVAVLFRQFASLENVPYDINVFDVVMHHDIVEVETIDLPSPVKSFSPKTKEAWDTIESEIIKNHFQLQRYSDENIKGSMTQLQHDLFKACDLLDLIIFVKEEIANGNKSWDMRDVSQNCGDIYLEKDYEHKFPHIHKFLMNYEF